MADTAPELPPSAPVPSDTPPDVRVIAAWQTAVTGIIFALAELAVLVGAGLLVYAGKLTWAEASVPTGPIIAAIVYGRAKGRTMTAAAGVVAIGSAIGAKLGAKGAAAAGAAAGRWMMAGVLALQLGACAAWQDAKPIVRPVVHDLVDWLLSECKAQVEREGGTVQECVDSTAAGARMAASSQ